MKDIIEAFKILGIMAIICIIIVLSLAEPALRFAAMDGQREKTKTDSGEQWSRSTACDRTGKLCEHGREPTRGREQP